MNKTTSQTDNIRCSSSYTLLLNFNYRQKLLKKKKNLKKSTTSKVTKNSSVNIYLFKVNTRNFIKRCKIFKIKNEDTKRRHWHLSGAFILNIFHTYF